MVVQYQCRWTETLWKAGTVYPVHQTEKEGSSCLKEEGHGIDGRSQLGSFLQISIPDAPKALSSPPDQASEEHVQSNINSDNPDPDLKVSSDPIASATFFDDLRKEYQNGFFVHITKERKDLKLTDAYVGRYARRPPLSELRIKDYTGEMITFEFIRKLVCHIPPHYFNIIRHYGILASRVKTAYKKITDKFLGKAAGVKAAQNWRERQTSFRGNDPLLCRICQRAMVFVSAYTPNPLSMVKTKLQSVFS